MELALLMVAFIASAGLIPWRRSDLAGGRSGMAETRRDRRRSMMAWGSILLLLPGILDASGRIWLLVACFWLGVWMWRLRGAGRRRWLIFPAAGLIALVAAHSHGYRLYGSAVVVDNRPLLPAASSHVLARLEPPDIAVAADGSRHRLAGMTFSPELLRVAPEELIAFLAAGGGRGLQFAPDGAFPSGHAAEVRFNYSCGNTLFPMLLPEPLPGYMKRDLGEVLIRVVAGDSSR